MSSVCSPCTYITQNAFSITELLMQLILKTNFPYFQWGLVVQWVLWHLILWLNMNTKPCRHALTLLIQLWTLGFCPVSVRYWKKQEVLQIERKHFLHAFFASQIPKYYFKIVVDILMWILMILQKAMNPPPTVLPQLKISLQLYLCQCKYAI